MPIVEGRNWTDRAFTVGIGVSSIQSLLLLLCTGTNHFSTLLRDCFAPSLLSLSHKIPPPAR